eukprot:TRINITY_DN36225_c0_g1_i1.p1 TRINITY_DN36225_c0_g1~~TRINITY_DN36225_c0_g1_i1.p1  ORF type:complete len:671 (-),score=-22.06 TRINITY_DN36225_c0_g1_i1:358-2370(-)
MPSSWTIRPVLLAGLLRCADATQLDQDRTPDFLYGLLQLRGVSETHWRAQNRLAHPHTDASEPQALIFSSTRPYEAQDADSWWIAFDSIGLANRELQATDALLRDLGLPSFRVNRIRGAEAAERLSQSVQVKGWRPIRAEVKISQVDRIIDLFGGRKLYGGQMWVPVRELIQNAADAIRYRRELEAENGGYEGRITARICDRGSQHVWLEIDDDGLGMSEAVLTGPLIDFGSSYVSSSLVKAERPGLLSKGLKRTGKFGIGFFSAFMIGSEIEVLSRPFDQGIDQLRILKFGENAQTRPILLDSVTGIGSTLSTRVRVKLKREVLDQVLSFGSPMSDSKVMISLPELIGAICPMLDVDIFVESDGVLKKIHPRNWPNEDRVAWLRRISLPNASKIINHPPDAIDAELVEAAKRLTFLDPDDPSAGLAAISGTAARGVRAIGMLKATDAFHEFDNEYWGAVDHQASEPRRSAMSVRSKSLLANWATEQALKTSQMVVSDQQKRAIAIRTAEFGGDATPIASISFNREWLSLEDAFTKACQEGKVYIPIKHEPYDTNPLQMAIVREHQWGLIDNYSAEELEFLVPIMEGSDSSSKAYFSIPTNEVPAPHSFLTMLHRLADERAVEITGNFLGDFPAAKYVGAESPRQRLTHGKEIRCNVLELTFITSAKGTE